MKINRDNYEAYFLDYHEGQLSPDMVQEVLLFVEKNPDLKNDFEEFEAVSLADDQNIVFEKKSSLKKNQSFVASLINDLNYEEYLLAETEGILNAAELTALEVYIKTNPQAEKDRKLFAMTHLTPENDIVFEARESLKKKAIPVGPITAGTFETFMARELEGDLHAEEKLQLDEFMQYNPHLERDRKLYTHTILPAETDIVYTGKSALKHSAAPVRRILYYGLSAAAILALIFSFYFLFERNEIPGGIAKQGQINIKTENTTDEPAAITSGNQLASKSSRVNDKVSAIQKPLVTSPQTESTNNNTTINKEAVALAFANRNHVEQLQSKSAVEITTRQYVDPQYTFIRASQMYIYQNQELYYNVRLAEQIAYAQLNAKDKNPGKTIFAATLEKVGGLFASNRAKPAPEEKKPLSLWTFAELGVQTFNTLTSSDVELNLKKDEKGKVIAYGIEGGILNFEKEVKK